MSYYFREHSVSKMSLGLFKALDQESFYTVLFQFGFKDKTTDRLAEHMSKFHHSETWTLAQAQQMMSNPAMAKQAAAAMENMDPGDMRKKLDEASKGGMPTGVPGVRAPAPAPAQSAAAKLKSSPMSVPDDLICTVEEAEECKAKGKQATVDFNTRLSRKQHAGSLAFDHDAETLALHVARNNQDENSSSTSDARGLSGGERSFTTLSFELAMWEFCATPFRVLDEFDWRFFSALADPSLLRPLSAALHDSSLAVRLGAVRHEQTLRT